MQRLKTELTETETEESRVLAALETYYDADGNLLEEYKTRLEAELKAVFLLPRMERFKSEYVLIRRTDHQNILDNLRGAKLWR